MKKILALIAVLAASTASISFAAPVTSAVFSITSTAVTSTANLRVVSMVPKTIGRDANSQLIQTILFGAGQTSNYFLTKTKTIDISNTLCILVQADQDTNMKINSESAFTKIYSGSDVIRCFK